MTRRAGPAGLAVRAATTHPALSLFAILIVALTAFVGAAAPGMLQQAQTDSVRYALRATGVAERDFSATVRGLPVTGGGRYEGLPDDLSPLWGRPLSLLAAAREHLTPRVRDVLDRPRLVVELDPSEASPDPLDPRPRTRLLIRYDPEVDDRVTWVEGREPAPSDDGAVEVGLTADAAAAMDWRIGEHRQLPRGVDTLQDVVLAGIYEVDDPADPDWAHAPLAVHYSRVQPGLENPLFTAVAFAAPADLAAASPYETEATVLAWYPFDLDGVRAADAGTLVADLRLFSATAVEFDLVTQRLFSSGISFRSTATATITQALVRVEAMSALVALIASGPVAASVVVLALTARMLALRRRTSLQLAAARGASLRLRAALLGAEGAIIGLIGGLAGGIAGAAVGGGDGAVVAVVPILAALTPAIALPVLGLLVARRPVRADLGDGDAPARRRRLVAETAVVAVAAVTTVLVLTHALGRDSAAPDPVLTAVPLLLAAVGCVVTLRLVPALLAVVERGVPARRGLVALVGPARARRDPSVRVAPVLAVVVGVAIAIFSVAFSATVESGIRVAARSAAGADLRVAAPYLAPDQVDALASLDGVSAIAPVSAGQQLDGSTGWKELSVTVYVIDVAAVRAVQTDPDAAIPLPDALLRDDGGAVPVVASDDLIAVIGADPLTLGRTKVDVVGAAPARSPLGSTRLWVAVDRSFADRLGVGDAAPAVVLIDLAPGADAARVAEAAREIAGPTGSASTPASLAAARLEDPALIGLQFALFAAIGVVAALLGLAIGMTLVLGAPARGRLLALLAAVGYRRSRELALVLWEVAPAVVVALPAGAAVGLALPAIVLPAIDLTGFVGGAAQPAVSLGGMLPAVVVLGFLLVAAVAVLIAALVARRVTAAGTLRSIDEEG